MDGDFISSFELRFEVSFLNFMLSHLELLDFAGRRRRELLHKSHVPRDLEVRHLQLTIFSSIRL